MGQVKKSYQFQMQWINFVLCASAAAATGSAGTRTYTLYDDIILYQGFSDKIASVHGDRFVLKEFVI